MPFHSGNVTDAMMYNALACGLRETMERAFAAGGNEGNHLTSDFDRGTGRRLLAVGHPEPAVLHMPILVTANAVTDADMERLANYAKVIIARFNALFVERGVTKTADPALIVVTAGDQQASLISVQAQMALVVADFNTAGAGGLLPAGINDVTGLFPVLNDPMNVTL